MSGAELPVVTQDPRFGGGLRSLVEAFSTGVIGLGRRPRFHYVAVAEGLSPRVRLRLRPRAEQHGHLAGVAYPSVVPELNVLNQAVNALRIGRRLRHEPVIWVVCTTAPYGAPALAARRPYACWLGTGLESEWAARRHGLAPSRRVALAINRPGLLALERRVVQNASLVFAISPASRVTIAEAGDLPLDAVTILPVPVDLERFRPLPDDEWQAGLESPTIAFVGRGSDPRKNVPLLLEAFQLLKTRIPSTRLRLIGEKPLFALPAGVDATGPVDDVALALNGATIFVLPSLQEGLGIVVAEALAAGIPTVVTPCGGPEELVRASGGGVVMEGFTAEELSNTLEELLTDPSRLLEARRRGRAHVEQEHSTERFTAILGRAFEQLNAEGGRAR